jgi:hypothetical protein
MKGKLVPIIISTNLLPGIDVNLPGPIVNNIRMCLKLTRGFNGRASHHPSKLMEYEVNWAVLATHSVCTTGNNWDVHQFLIQSMPSMLTNQSGEVAMMRQSDHARPPLTGACQET